MSYRIVHRFTAKSVLTIDAVIGYWLKYFFDPQYHYRITIERARV